MFTDTEHRILLSAMGRELDICKQVDKEVCREPYEQSLESVCRSINKKIHDIQHKYKWHDLRKEPNDLPKEGMFYIYIDGLGYGATYYIDGKWIGYRKDGVIAWREIEPFREVE